MLHALLYSVALFVILKLLKRIKKLKELKYKNFGFLKDINHTNLIMYSLFLGMGVSLTLASVKIYPHYMIILFPFIQLLLVKILFKNKKILSLVIISQALISIIFFTSIHVGNGIKNSHYGKTYKQKCLVEKRENCSLDWIKDWK